MGITTSLLHPSPRPITILFYNDFWPSVPDSLNDCNEPYRFAFDRAAWADADAIVFHLPTMARIPEIPKRAEQLWVGWTMESDANYPHQAHPAILCLFDLTMSYRRASDIWCPYFGTDALKELKTPPKRKSARAPAVYIASNSQDRSGRNTYVRKLMEYLRIDSFGRCLQNRSFPKDQGRATKLKTISRYRFTLAFENSICADYVTEKFFDPLIAGSVPVYLGAPNVKDYSPGENAFIDARSFRSPEHLAEYLSSIADQPEEYGRYLLWKQNPLRKEFLQSAASLAKHPFSKLVEICALRRGLDEADTASI